MQKTGHIGLVIDGHVSAFAGLRSAKSSEPVAELNRLRRFWETFVAAKAANEANTHLTPGGKAAQDAVAAQVLVSDATAWRDRLVPGLEAHAESIRKQFAGGAAKSQDSSLKAEVRRRVAELGLEQQQLELFYASGDPLVREALEEMPSITLSRSGVPVVRPFVSAAVRDRVLLSEAEQARPDLADQLHDVELVRSAYLGAFNAVIGQAAPPSSLPALDVRDARTRLPIATPAGR